MADEIPVGSIGCDLTHDHPDETPPEVKVVVYFHVPRVGPMYSTENVLAIAESARRAQDVAAEITALLGERMEK